MFDIGWSELLVIAIVAIIVVGPKDLPVMLRAIGRTVGKLRRTADMFRAEFNEALRETEVKSAMDSLKSEMDGLRSSNPITEVRSSIEQTLNAPEPKSGAHATNAAITDPLPAMDETRAIASLEDEVAARRAARLQAQPAQPMAMPGGTADTGASAAGAAAGEIAREPATVTPIGQRSAG